MQFKSFTLNPFQQNTYLAYKNGKAWLFDAGFYHKHEYAELEQFLTEQNLKLQALLLTHGHLDHIFGVNEITKKYKVSAWLNKDENVLAENAGTQSAMYGIPMEPINVTFKPLEEQKEFALDDFVCQTLLTPGHSPGHISFYFETEDVLIAGDTLFAGSIGRTDLYRGSFAQLEKSIKEKLYTLPDSTRVLSGHGPETTIRQEKQFNPYVKA